MAFNTVTVRKLFELVASQRSRACAFGLLLAALTIFVYRPSWNGGFLWDDDDYITHNELLTAPDGLRRIWFSLDSPSQYFPLVYTTFRIEHALWGMNPIGYHWINLILHVANALLVWRVLARLNVPGSWLAGAIFALHPVQVESVAWITERKNVLMGFFFLLTLLAWIAFIDERTKRPWRFYALALILYLLALSAKVLVASRAVWFYLGKLIWPGNLTFIYPKWQISSTHLPDYMWLLVGIGLCVAIYFLRRYVGRSVEVAAGFFVATLSPVLGFIMLFTFRYTFVADHYQYLACIGPIALVSAGVVSLADMLKDYRVFILTAALFVVATLAVLTWRQSAMYGDIETLWRITLKRNPECWMAHTNLGIVLLQKGQLDDGIAQYRAALQMQPDSWDAEYNLGTALVTKGEVDEAILHCERAVAMQPNDPDSQVSLGNALLQKKRIDEAIVHYQNALGIRPDYSLAHYGLGRAFLEKGEADNAIQHFRTALVIRPDDADCHTVLAVALDEKGETPEAIHHYEKALVIFPKSISALTNLAWLRATSSNEALRNGNEAVTLAGQADELSGGTNAVVLRTLAAAYAETGQFAKAIESSKTALQLARVHGDQSLAVELEQQIAVYELRLPYRETRK